MAVGAARKSLGEGGIPIGAAIIANDGRVLSTGHNQRIQKRSTVLHGEMDALENTGILPASELRSATLFTTLSPCSMCTGAILLYGIPRVVVLDSEGFLGEEAYLRAKGVEVVNAADPEMIEIFAQWKEAHPELWNQDIGLS